MNSVGVFREKEINGKPFYIFTLLISQTDNTSPSSSSSDDQADIDSGGDNDLSLHQPRFLCPRLRFQAGMVKQEDDSCYSMDVKIVPFKTSPHFPNGKGVDQQHDDEDEDEDDDDDDDDDDRHHDDNICKDPILPLFWCNNNPNAVDSHLECPVCEKPLESGSGCYLCVRCDRIYHKECVESPLEIKAHPSYPFLSLRLCVIGDRSCSFCETQIYGLAYLCPTYKLSMHPVCALKPIPIVIEHFKRHPHPLTFFPKQPYLPCDVCGLVKQFMPTYICTRCVFVAHQDCIYFPYVIRISRHQHRLSFTSFLPSGELSCGVCRRKVDNHCGAYSCNQCDGYFVHPRCALRRDLWDGKELEEVPEEPEVVIEPFETIYEGIILHFSHRQHHLKLEISSVYDENKYCQGCILPIYQGNYYSCVDDHCDFILHEACAKAPLKIHNPLHAHSLALKIVTKEYNERRGYFFCDACWRQSCGFAYEGSGEGENTFRLDLRCASVVEPFHYEGHEHPLFLALTPEEEESAICDCCKGPLSYCRKLNCIKCNYIICFRCATLPYKARYKHDKHFLTFRVPKVASDELNWCEACESNIAFSPKPEGSYQQGFYVCDEYCCTTLHADCLLGRKPYMMKPGHTVDKETTHILCNNTMSRPFCHHRNCRNRKKRCSDRVFFKRNNSTYCD